jgi:outer membrane protein assembly factor BamA
MNLLSRVHVSLWLIIVLFVGVQAHSQDVSKTQFKLTKINFEGLASVPKEKAVEATGLKIGQTILLENLKQTSQLLLESGLFNSVKLRYFYNGDQLEVTYVVVEVISSVPCFFDNFMWFSDEEILAAIRKDIPNFDGKATEGGEMIDVIRKSLEKLVRTKSSTGVIEHEMGGNGSAHVFKVSETTMPICSIEYQGNTIFNPAQLTGAAKELLNSDYSRITNRLIVRETIMPMYLEAGFLKIKTLALKATPELSSNPKCKNGATLILSFNEGVSYKWNGVNWSGNQVLSKDKLDKLFQLKMNETADGLKINKGLNLTNMNYQERGYFDAEIKPVPTFDEAVPSVSYAVTISEGEQYKFGELAVKGLSESVTKNFQQRWEALRGKPYDAQVMQGFVAQASRENSAEIKLTQRASIHPNPVKASRTVDLVIEF